MRSRVHSSHALTPHACAVVEVRFVTERKKKNEAEFIPRAFPSESPSNYNYMIHHGSYAHNLSSCEIKA